MLQQFLHAGEKVTNVPWKELSGEYRHLHLVQFRNHCPPGPDDRRKQTIIIQIYSDSTDDQVRKLYEECEDIRATYVERPLIDVSRRLRVDQKVPYLGRFKSIESGNLFEIQSPYEEVFVIYVWATWCTPCLVPVQQLHRLLERNIKDENWARIRGIGVCLDSDLPEAQSKIMGKGIDHLIHHVILDSEFPEEHPIMKHFEITGVPFLVIMDRKRRLQYAGMYNSVDVEHKLNNLVVKDPYYKRRQRERDIVRQDISLEESEKLLKSISYEGWLREHFMETTLITQQVTVHYKFTRGVNKTFAQIVCFAYEKQIDAVEERYKEVFHLFDKVNFIKEPLQSAQTPFFGGFCFECQEELTFPCYFCKWDLMSEDNDDGGIFRCRKCMEAKPEEEDSEWQFNYVRKSIYLPSQIRYLPQIRLGSEVIHPFSNIKYNVWPFRCNSCNNSPKESSVARYVCIYCRSDPSFFGEYSDYCSDCVEQFLDGNEAFESRFKDYGHSIMHPLIRIPYCAQDYAHF